MEIERVNRLPMLTYRYLKTNDSPLPFRAPEKKTGAVFSDAVYIERGAVLPEGFTGASDAWKREALRGEKYTVHIPEGVEAALTIDVKCDSDHPDYAGAFAFVLEKNAHLQIIWKWEGTDEEGAVTVAASYSLADGAVLHSSHVETGMEKKILCFQRYTEAQHEAKAYFAAAELGGDVVIVHSRGFLYGKESAMHESDLYTSCGDQHLDLFYHIDHIGEDTECDIDVKGAMAGESKKIFRGIIDFKRGSAGAVGSEGDYAIQLSPKTKNISLPLLLCTEDNVEGNHASSAGQIDQGTIYYLMTRGFSYEEARRIVVESLIQPLIDKLDPSLHEEVLSVVREKLDEETREREAVK